MIYWLSLAALGLFAVVFYGVSGIAAAAAGSSVWYVAVSAVMQTIVATVWGAVQTSLYVELRLWKDGPTSERLADIFA